MTPQQLQMELQRGGRFVIYQYAISVGVASFKRSSAIHLIRAGESAMLRGLKYSAISFLLGWWGIPWGPIFTIGAIFSNMGGGKDVTAAVAPALLNQQP